MKTKPITKTEYTKLVPAIADYRNALKAAVGIKGTQQYSTVYTEQRTYGARSKFWMSSFNDKQLNKMRKFIEKNPNVSVGKKVYSVSLKKSPELAGPYGYRGNDTQLVFSCK